MKKHGQPKKPRKSKDLYIEDGLAYVWVMANAEGVRRLIRWLKQYIAWAEYWESKKK